jgi:RNA-binding protein
MLTGKQKRQLRALGHSLKPIIQIGKKEIEEGLINETNIALDCHELVKVKLLESCQLGRGEAAEILANACSADIAQILGRTFLLYRQAKDPVITFNCKDQAPRKSKTVPPANTTNSSPAKNSYSGHKTNKSGTRSTPKTADKKVGRKP